MNLSKCNYNTKVAVHLLHTLYFVEERMCTYYRFFLLPLYVFEDNLQTGRNLLGNYIAIGVLSMFISQYSLALTT